MEPHAVRYDPLGLAKAQGHDMTPVLFAGAWQHTDCGVRGRRLFFLPSRNLQAGSALTEACTGWDILPERYPMDPTACWRELHGALLLLMTDFESMAFRAQAVERLRALADWLEDGGFPRMCPPQATRRYRHCYERKAPND